MNKIARFLWRFIPNIDRPLTFMAMTVAWGMPLMIWGMFIYGWVKLGPGVTSPNWTGIYIWVAIGTFLVYRASIAEDRQSVIDERKARWRKAVDQMSSEEVAIWYQTNDYSVTLALKERMKRISPPEDF